MAFVPRSGIHDLECAGLGSGGAVRARALNATSEVVSAIRGAVRCPGLGPRVKSLATKVASPLFSIHLRA
jgi:hypothetical protein